MVLTATIKIDELCTWVEELIVSLHRFQVFASVAKNLSVTKASRELHSSQPALSQHLKILQNEYGLLFKKAGGRIELTDHGQSLLLEIEPVLSQIAEIEKKYSGNSVQARSQTLVVGGSYGPSASVLPSAMAKFKRNNPKVDLSLNTRPGREIADLVLQSRVDIAVILSQLSSSPLEIEPFRNEVQSVFVATNHALAERKQIDIAEFATLPLVIRGWKNNGRGWTDELLRTLFEQRLKPDIAMRCESPDAVKRVVREKAGVGILHRDLIESEVQAGILKIVEVSGLRLSRQSYILFNKEKPLSPNARGFLALLRTAGEHHHSK